MIDEKKLIDEIEERRRFWENRAAEYDEAGKIEMMDICDSKAMELCGVLKDIAEQPKVSEWIPCSERLPKDSFIDVEVTADDGERYIPQWVYKGSCRKAFGILLL